MKIKIYIITYKGDDKVRRNLDSLSVSDIIDYEYEVYIINNHSSFNINNLELDSFSMNNIKILHNVLRPDFSNGHLSRNWNQAIVNGFKDLNKPDCDILIHCQDDTLWEKDCFKKLINVHEKFTFIQYGLGDQFCSYLPEAVKKIGLWDERFNSITMQGEDYFTRAVRYNYYKTTVTDPRHMRKHNPLPNLNLIKRPPGKTWEQKHKGYGIRFFEMKWGMSGRDAFNKATKGEKINPHIESYMMYPYFEKDVDDLKGKGYFE